MVSEDKLEANALDSLSLFLQYYTGAVKTGRSEGIVTIDLFFCLLQSLLIIVNPGLLTLLLN